MLKYDFDDKKRSTFLTFWNIKNMSEWKGLIEKNELVFFYLLFLPYELRITLSQLIQFSIKKQQFSIQTDAFKVASEQMEKENFFSNREEIDYKKIEMLDTLNFLSYKKVDPLNRNKKAFWVWEKWFMVFLLKASILPPDQKVTDYILRDLLKKKTICNNKTSDLEITKNAKDLLDFIHQNFILPSDKDLAHFKKKIDLKALVTLIQQNILLPIISLSRNFSQTLLIHPKFYDYKKANFLTRKKIQVEKLVGLFKLHEMVLSVDREIYQTVTNHHLPASEIKIAKKIKIIAEKIVRANRYLFYLDLDFREKINFILAQLSPNYPFLLKELSNHIPPQKSVSELKLIFLLRKINESSFGKILLLEEAYEVIYDFILLGLISCNKNFFYLNEFLSWSLPDSPIFTNEVHPTRQKLIIDSDMSITVFKNIGDEELLYYLNIFTDKKSHTYSWQFEINYKLVNFAWFLNFNEEKIITFLEKYQNENMSADVIQYIKLFFENCDLLKKFDLPSFRIPSTIKYHQIKYELENKIDNKKPKVIFLDEKKIVIFLDKGDYLNFIQKNWDQKDYKII